MEKNLWIFKSVQEVDRAAQTIDSYEDSLEEYYNYDNFVANSQQVKKNDLALIINKKEILGFTIINNIFTSEGNKTIRRCPSCASTTIDLRKHKRPKYRCNRGHEFGIPNEEIKAVKKYKATYSNYISVKTHLRDLKQLRPFYVNGFNQNMSIQKLSIDALDLFDSIKEILNKDLTLLPNQALNIDEYNNYIINEYDERETILKAIKIRRGQQDFRKELLKKYNSTCIITGCKIVEILEAAHINPYRGEKENHISNGLLLRADIHTLFDLDLLAINPENFAVEISCKLSASEYSIFSELKLNRETFKLISKDVLATKWLQFKEKNKSSLNEK